MSPRRGMQLAEIVGLAVLFICAVAVAVALGAIALGGWLIKEMVDSGKPEPARELIKRVKSEELESKGRHAI